MNKYEVLYILTAGLDDAAKEAEIEKLNAVITENGGEVANVNKWGLKRFAYPIDFKNEGYYVLTDFNARPDFIGEFGRRLKLSENVVRFMIVKKK
ncbi:MAG: 30S ribosomal protein S6 [Clostridiales bacterium]|jgi:small subunit ribosomal protein S6|nr:30S ribosomal protein S6 [Clostridiales bacterium]